jgi:hypothetical protein
MFSVHSDGIESASLCVKEIQCDNGKTCPLDFRLSLKIIWTIFICSYIRGLMMAPCSWNMLPWWYVCISTRIKWCVKTELLSHLLLIMIIIFYLFYFFLEFRYWQLSKKQLSNKRSSVSVKDVDGIFHLFQQHFLQFQTSVYIRPKNRKTYSNLQCLVMSRNKQQQKYLNEDCKIWQILF